MRTSRFEKKKTQPMKIIALDRNELELKRKRLCLSFSGSSWFVVCVLCASVSDVDLVCGGS